MGGIAGQHRSNLRHILGVHDQQAVTTATDSEPGDRATSAGQGQGQEEEQEDDQRVQRRAVPGDVQRQGQQRFGHDAETPHAAAHLHNGTTPPDVTQPQVRETPRQHVLAQTQGEDLDTGATHTSAHGPRGAGHHPGHDIQDQEEGQGRHAGGADLHAQQQGAVPRCQLPTREFPPRGVPDAALRHDGVAQAQEAREEPGEAAEGQQEADPEHERTRRSHSGGREPLQHRDLQEEGAPQREGLLVFDKAGAQVQELRVACEFEVCLADSEWCQ